ncbi:MAG: hypothetical protein NXI31_27055 [bacterium]|nr:hypothetical protein [bacterium]
MRSLLVLIVTTSCALVAQAGEKPDFRAHRVFTELAAAAKDSTRIVAHRGAASTHPENTLPALRAAIAAGAPVVEFDVYQTRDGHWVLFHDKTVGRTTDAAKVLGRGDVRIGDLTLAEVGQLDAGSWFDARFAKTRVPTLAAALQVVLPAAVPMIERKGGDPAAFVAELRRLEVVDRVLVQAFDWDFLAAAHRLEPRLLIAALGGGDLTAERLADLRRTGAAMVHWDHRSLTVEGAAAVLASRRLLCVYTVNPDCVALGAAAMSCHLVTTDRPARLVALRQRGRLRRRP